MGVIHLENVDDKVIDAIKLSADLSGRTFDEELRALLDNAAMPRQAASPQERVAAADRIRAMTKGYSAESDSVNIIRELRDGGYAGR